MQNSVNLSPLPLFDRLAVEIDPGQAFAETLSWSISRDLRRLLTTRSRLDFTEYGESDGGVLDYGVPDCASRSVHSVEDREVIANAIRRAIERFEPRLANVAVALVPLGVSASCAVVNAVVSVRGDIVPGGVVRHVEFEFGLEGLDG